MFLYCSEDWNKYSRYLMRYQVELTEKNARVADSENWIPLSYYFCFPSWLCFNYFSSLVVFDTWNICESLHMRVFFFFFFYG